MKHKILEYERKWTIVCVGIFLFGAATEAVAQTRRARPAPVTTVNRPQAGSGVGSVTGSGLGTATGTGIGRVTGSGTGTSARSLIVTPAGRSAGSSTGNATGTQSGSATGTGNGNGTGSSSGGGTGTGTDTPVITRTYIKELNGRCYFVTPQGLKHYVERRRCALYP